jgi:hypothetical protein
MEEKLLAVEMGFWKRSARISWKDTIFLVQLQKQMGFEIYVLDYMRTDRLIQYGHTERMAVSRWPKQVLEWM